MHSTPVLKSQLKGLAAAEGNAKNTDDLLRCIAREVSNYTVCDPEVVTFNLQRVLHLIYCMFLPKTCWNL